MWFMQTPKYKVIHRFLGLKSFILYFVYIHVHTDFGESVLYIRANLNIFDWPHIQIKINKEIYSNCFCLVEKKEDTIYINHNSLKVKCVAPPTHKNHLFQKGHTVVLFLLNQCLKILHFISFTYAERPQRFPT